MAKKILIALVILAAGAVLSVYTIFLLYPTDMIRDRAFAEIRGRTGYAVTAEDFNRAFPLGYTAGGVVVRDRTGKELVAVETMTAMLRPLTLLSGSLKVGLDGRAGGGVVDGFANMGPRGMDAVVDADGVGLGVFRAVPEWFPTGGSFDARAEVTTPYGGFPTGSVTADGSGMRGGDVRLGAFTLPVGVVDDAGLKAVFTGPGEREGDCGLRVDEMWLEGKMLTVRLNGKVTLRKPVEASVLAMTLEIVPSGDLAELGRALTVLEPFRKSSSYYRARVSGTVGFPMVRPE